MTFPGFDRRARWVGLAVPALLLLGAAVRALRLLAPFHWPFYWDETKLATPALLILRGDLPVSAGPEYFGAAPSYALAMWFAVAGTSTLANDVYGYGISLLIFWTGWLVLRRFLDRPAALLGLAVLAVPPLFLTQWSSSTSGTHPTLLILGNLCLLATHTIFVADPGRRRALLALGLLAGFGWWTNPLIVVYLAPFALLALRTGLAWRPRLAWFAGGLLLGGLPQWLYELRYFPSSKFALHQAGGAGLEPIRERMVTVGSKYLPPIFGLDVGAGGTWLTAFGLLSVLLWAVALIRAGIRDRNELAWMVGLGGRRDRGQGMLWLVAGAALAVAVVTKRPLYAHYLLPLYSVLPCWMGEGLAWLRRRRPWLAGAALAALLAAHGWANWHDSAATTSAAGRRWAAVERRSERLVRWLGSRGIDRAYTTDPPNFSPDAETYLSGERVVFADQWREHMLAHGRQVDAAPSPAIVTAGPALRRLRAGLETLDLAVREAQVGELHVLEPEPRFATTFVPLPRDRWTIAASDNAARAADLLDGDAATSWDTGGAQTPGQSLTVDLGAAELLTRVDLLALDWQNVPAGLRVDVSPDGQRWEPVVTVPEYWGPLFFSEHHAFLKVRRGRVQAIFPPVRARHLRLVQTAAGSRPWAARELFAYAPGGPRPAVPRPGEITAALRREGVAFVYANHWLSAWVRVDSRDRIGALDSNINVNDYSRTEPAPTELLPPRLEAGIAFLLGADADPAGVRAMLAGQAVAVRESHAGPYPLLVLTPAPAPRRLPKTGWRATASEAGDQALRAIDDDRRTQWVSGPPGPAPLTVTLDLGAPRPLRGVEVRPGLPGRALRLAASLDATTWTDLAPLTWAGALYWTGTELLRNGGPKWAVTFPPTTLRYLRLSPAAPRRDPWTIAELEVLE